MFARSLLTKGLLLLLMALFILSVSNIGNVAAAPAKKFKVAWSIYAGWQPWDYANKSGILKKWADKYGIEIELVRMSYPASLDAFVADKANVDACVMTNMEALDMPASAGISTTSIIPGDYSNDNDAVITRDGLGFADLRGKEIILFMKSVSHYLLVRGLEKNGLRESDVKLTNTSDEEIAMTFIGDKSKKVVVTWNPMVMNIMKEMNARRQPEMTKIFGSSQIPGEILDLMVVKTSTLKAHPELGKALVGAWYEVMAIMAKKDEKAKKAFKVMADSSSCTVEEYEKQLETTALFYTPAEAVKFSESPEFKKMMKFVRDFCFTHDMLGERAKSADRVGIQYPDGEILGDKSNVKLIFSTEFIKLAAQGKL